MSNPPITPAMLEQAHRLLRDDSVNTALEATPQIGFLGRLSSAQKAEQMLVEALAQWAMRPTQRHANGALGCLTVFREKNSEDGFQQLLVGMSQAIDHHRGLMWNQLIFMVIHLPKPTLKSTAALNLCVLYPAREVDTLAGPRFVSELSLDKRLHNETRAALIAGALQLGDPRTTGFLLDAWKKLPVEVRRSASMIQPGIAHVPYIDFLLGALGWESDAGIYGALAGQLGRFAGFGGDDSPFVSIKRVFPSWASNDGPFISREVYSKSEVAEEIHDRLVALKAAEKGEPVMPMLIDLWSNADDGGEADEDGSNPLLDADAQQRPFDEMAGMAFTIFYNPSRPGEDRLKDSMCGGVLMAIKEIKSPEDATRLLAPHASSDSTYSANVSSTAQVATYILNLPAFQQRFTRTGNYSGAAQFLASTLYNLFALSYSPVERAKGTKELAFEALYRGLVFSLVLWRDRPQLARKIADGLGN